MADRQNDVQPLLPTNTNAPKRKSCCRRVCCAFAYLLSILITIALTVGVTLLVQYFQQEQPTARPKLAEKTILLWNQPANDLENYPTALFQEKFTCPWTNRTCLVTNNRNFLANAHLVVLAAPLNYTDMPQNRDSNQIYLKTNGCLQKRIYSYYNRYERYSNDDYSCSTPWRSKPTMTQRSGEIIDFPAYNFDWEKSWGAVNLDLSKLALKKWNAALLKQQPCKENARLEELISDLKKYTTFNSYGVCNETIRVTDSNGDYIGNYTVQLEQNPAPIASYKFVLLFEDEITSNFYEVLRNWAVPVVFTSENVTRYAPPKSYINGYDFKTMRELADHLNYLIENPSEYLQYFWWHNVYQLSDINFKDLCSLCEDYY